MSEIKEKAIKKVTEEIEKEHTEIDKAIYDWLVTQEDEALFTGVLEEKKSIELARQYAYNQAYKVQVGGCAVVKSDDVFSWVTEYFKTPMIVASKGQLLKEEKAKEKEVVPKCINTVKKSDKPIKEKQTREMMEGEQLDLLAFL